MAPLAKVVEWPDASPSPAAYIIPSLPPSLPNSSDTRDIDRKSVG